MKRRQFLSISLGLPALLAALTSGCGSGGGSAPISGAFSPSGNNGGTGNGGGNTPADILRGAAEGYAFLNASGAVVLLPTAASGTQAGFAPASGVRAEIEGGPSGTVGADGLLRLENIPAGLRKLRMSDGSASAALEIPLTVVPNAVLPLGAPTVSRASAVQAATQAAQAQIGGDALIGADILATSTPLPAGVTIHRAIVSDDLVATVAQPSWFVYVDLIPSARFGHDTLLVLVDAETGAVTLQDSDSWPLLNGATFYGLATVNATSQDAVQVASRAKSVLFVLPPVEAQTTVGRAAPGTCRAADPDEAKTHYLIIQGDSRPDFGFDPPTIQSFLSGAPFPPVGQMTFLKTFEQDVEPRVAIVNAFNAVRDAAKTGDTLVLYVTTHGTLRFGNLSLPPELRYKMACESGQGFNGTATAADGKVYQTNLVDIRELDFSPCKACRIVLLIDTCYSGNWIPILRPQLDALEKPRDLLVFTAADQIHPAIGLYGNTPVDLGAESATVAGGGLFTQSLLVAANRQKTVLVKDAVSTDVLATSFDTAKALTDADNQANIDKQMLGAKQNPQRYVRPLDPDEVCGKGNQNVAIK